MFALIDCNNFFVSCERAFQPKLQGVPVVVLSSNDGCVVSRSNEAKELGVPMGVPFFQFKDFFAARNIRVFSSNFRLYSDMSERVMSLLEQFSDLVEIYSVDEAFLQVPKHVAPAEWGKALRETILRSTGIPVSVGIARTKTLAKVAARKAKEEGKRGGPGVFDLEASSEKGAILGSMTAGEIWGIGGASARKLLKCNIKTALDLAKAPDRVIREKLGIGGLKIALELRGVRTLGRSSEEEGKQSIRSTRSFGRGVYAIEELRRSLAIHADRAAAKMRQQGSAATYLSIFIATGKHSEGGRWYGSAMTGFDVPTTDTSEIISRSREMLEEIFRPGLKYAKSGVMLGGFVPENIVPATTLFGGTRHDDRRQIMRLVDAVNGRFGSGALRPLAALPEKSIAARSQFVSPEYTTSWEGILKVKLVEQC
ncbi:MAG TPA: Y-family DNA polymerase [Candidatus Paceibacterota bacterium]|nr:Y-family DNA polymerase [Candidatus Paceibacterota bacterium]